MTPVELAIQYIATSIPLGITLGIAVKICNFAYGLFLGKGEVKL